MGDRGRIRAAMHFLRVIRFDISFIIRGWLRSKAGLFFSLLFEHHQEMFQ